MSLDVTALGAEAALIGCVLSGESRRIVDSVVARAGEWVGLFTHHTWHGCASIIQACLDKDPEAKAVDMVVFCDLSQKSGSKSLAGAAAKAIGECASPESWPKYTDMLMEAASSRRFASILREADSELQTGEEGLGELVNRCADRMVSLAEHINVPAERRGQREISYRDAVRDAITDIEAKFNAGGGITGLPTGLVDLDRMLDGLHPGELIVVAARPSIGKTQLGLHMANHNALAGTPVGFFSLEMPAKELAKRALAATARVNIRSLGMAGSRQVDIGKLVEASGRLSKAPIWFEDKSAMTMPEIAARARTMARRYKVSLLVVDYLQIVTTAQSKNDTRAQAVAEVSSGLKRVARELGIPVIVLSQLNRCSDKENRRPQLSDLRDSGAIEQDADVVIMIHRERLDAGQVSSNGGAIDVELVVAKQRNGPIGTVKALFRPDMCSFESKAYQDLG